MRYDSLPADVGSYLKITEALEILKMLNNGSKERVKKEVVQNNIFDYNTSYSRKCLFSTVSRAFLHFTTKKGRETFLKILRTNISKTSKKQILFYTLCRNSYTTYRLTLDVFFPRYIQGNTKLPKEDVLRYLMEKSKTTKTVREWTEETRETVAGKYLTLMKKFGFLKGRQKKEFIYFSPELEPFVYVVYRLLNEGKTPKKIANSEKFKLLMLQERDVLKYLRNSANTGYINFAQAGDVYEITPKYKLKELANAFAKKHERQV